MPVFHFVLHAYGTWHPDHPSGWHQHGGPGTLRPDLPLARHRRSTQRWESAAFPSHIHFPLIDMAIDICRRRTWRCHAVAVNQTHVHVVASWYGDLPALDVQHTVKRLLGWRATKLTSIQGRRWFSDGGIPKRVRDAAHLHYLIHEYLAHQGGAYWKESS